MVQYSALYSEKFKKDLSRTLAYVTYNLKNPDAALALEKEVYNETEKRGKLAKAFKPYIYDKNKKALYHVKVGKFYAFYYIDEKKKKIKYVAFLYAKMNVKNVLKVVNKNPLV